MKFYNSYRHFLSFWYVPIKHSEIKTVLEKNKKTNIMKIQRHSGKKEDFLRIKVWKGSLKSGEITAEKKLQKW